MVIAARNWLEEDLAWTPSVSGLYLLRTVSLGELPVSRSASGFRVNAHTTLPSGLSATAHLGLALPGCSSRLSLSACHSFLFFLIILFFLAPFSSSSPLQKPLFVNSHFIPLRHRKAHGRKHTTQTSRYLPIQY